MLNKVKKEDVRFVRMTMNIMGINYLHRSSPWTAAWWCAGLCGFVIGSIMGYFMDRYVVGWVRAKMNLKPLEGSTL